MTKLYKLIATISLSLLAFNLSAQFVTIPDANFAAYLNTVVPSAMSGNQMDTTSTAVTTLSRIDVENMGIADLTGVQYFKSLITLDCGSGSPSTDTNRLTSLPALPNTLDTLICGNTRLTVLNKLPSSLKVLWCYINKLDSIPNLPNTLVALRCYDNQLKSLPSLPASFTYLDCSSNQISTIPTLPGNMQTLACAGNLLTSLPVLPSTLTFLDCSVNQLTNLPPLPGTLTSLWCYLNELTSLPSLPGGLLSLYCENNSLTSLPSLPNGLIQLQCQNNSISCFPLFPTSLNDSNLFFLTPNPFTCLPNYVAGMTTGTLAYPLCAAGNSNGCPSSQGIVGYTYKDMNSDCIMDGGDVNLSNIPVQLYDSNNNLLSQTYSAGNGVYNFYDSAGKYSVVVDTTGMPFMVQCSHPGYDSTLVLKSIDTNVDFSFTCKSGFDVGVQSVGTNGLVFPGMQHSLSVVAGDMSQWYNLNCASGIGGTVQIIVSGPVTYVGPGAGALTPSVAGNIYTYAIADYGAINNLTAFNLLFNTDTTAIAGDTICVSVNVTPGVDNNPGNNTYQYCYGVVNSHDPNIKETYPVSVAPGYNGWFTYTIHFQNTGNAAATNILITDTLDKNLDMKTFQLIDYSNKNTVNLSGNVLMVRFPNINLADSIGNQKGSTGFIQYSVKPKSGLPGGTVIKNTGYIYFDYNEAVVTNTTQNIYSVITGLNNIRSDASAKLFPNPNNGKFTIQLSEVYGKPTIEIYNVLGEKVYQQFSIPNSQFSIDLTNQPAGIYFYRVITESGSLISSGKVIIE
ncbi:MAG TPA: T9SS type A sorting domain-containing protein [Bacteroidia bacterium]|jgi:uncharacterized repeat protein (TIGR01451 family)|nr:T9SS type A sorting domain-containing protein [Bacteroidia bacterium]